MLTSTLEQAVVGCLFLALLVALVIFVFYPALVDRNSDGAARPTAVTLHGSSNTDTPSLPPPLLSIVIPAYEEEVRLPHMLLDAFTYLSSAKCAALIDLASLSASAVTSPRQSVVEWIVVNDGSKDNTSQAYRDFIDTHVSNTKDHASSVWKLICLETNRGKGAAVRTGMLAATGEYCLMVDADGATDFAPGLAALAQRLTMSKSDALTKSESTPTRQAIVLGSRAHLQTESTEASESSSGESTTTRPPRGRSVLRSLLMHIFHWCVVVLIGAHDVRDTQCGFKLFHRSAAVALFRNLHLQRWAFDTELLFLATQLRYELHEVDIAWHDVAGSKLHTSALNLALVSICMLRDMACVRLCYTLGLWKIRRKED